MAKQSRYETDSEISLEDRLTGIDADDSNKTKNFSFEGIVGFIKSQTTMLYEVQGYLIWQGSGVKDETTIKQGNIVLGRGEIIDDLFLGEAKQDNPTQESHFNMLIQVI